MKKNKTSIICLLNGIFAIISGAVPKFLHAVTPYYGYPRDLDADYNRAVFKMISADSRGTVLLIFGVILLICALLLEIKKPKESKKIHNILFFVPLTIILVFLIVNVVPFISFNITYN